MRTWDNTNTLQIHGTDGRKTTYNYIHSVGLVLFWGATIGEGRRQQQWCVWFRVNGD